MAALVAVACAPPASAPLQGDGIRIVRADLRGVT
jgi:hypothetical protein